MYVGLILGFFYTSLIIFASSWVNDSMLENSHEGHEYKWGPGYQNICLMI